MIVPRGMSGIVQDLASAIARQENVSPAYNNPGGLIAAPGCTSRPGQIAICPDAATGEAGLERQIQLDINRGWTLSDLIGSWAPKCNQPICAGNDPATYTANVATWTGLPTDIPLNSISATGAAAAPSLDTSAIDTASVIDLSGFSGSGWIWGGAVAAVLLLALALER